MLHNPVVSLDVTMQCPGRPPLLIALSIVSLSVATTAAAHPFGDDEYAHRVVLRAHEASLRVEYSIEIPTQVIMLQFAHLYGGSDVGDQQDEAFARRMFEELGANLSLVVGGSAVEVQWEPVPDVPNGVGTGRFFVYHIRATAPVTWSVEGVDLLLTNDNAVEKAAYYSGWIFADPGITVVASSLDGMGAAAAAGDVFNEESAWSRDSVYRDVAATIGITQPDLPQEQGRGVPWWLVLVPLAALAGWGIGVLVRRPR